MEDTKYETIEIGDFQINLRFRGHNQIKIESIQYMKRLSYEEIIRILDYELDPDDCRGHEFLALLNKLKELHLTI